MRLIAFPEEKTVIHIAPSAHLQSRGEFGLLFHLSIFTSDQLRFEGKQPTLNINNKVMQWG